MRELLDLLFLGKTISVHEFLDFLLEHLLLLLPKFALVLLVLLRLQFLALEFSVEFLLVLLVLADIVVQDLNDFPVSLVLFHNLLVLVFLLHVEFSELLVLFYCFSHSLILDLGLL